MNKILGMGDFEQRIDSIFSMLRCTHDTQAELIERYNITIEQELHSKTPNGRRRYSNYMKGYVFGYYMACSRALYNEMEFCYQVNGVLYSTSKHTTRHKVDELYGTDSVALLHTCQKGSYWPDVDRVYFDSN